MEIQHFSHEHALTFCMPSDQEADDREALPRCSGCFSYIREPAYTCGDCSFWLHKSCSELPGEIEGHPFHSAHSLCLHYSPDIALNLYMCDGCQELCFGLKYFCKLCNFFLDIRCACLTNEEAEASKGPKPKTTIFHFSHPHQLTWCSMREELSVACLCFGCEEVKFGSAYVCIRCRFILHESCLNDMPKEEVEHPFHPQHHLLLQPMEDYSREKCDACHEEIVGIKFNCEDCNFYLHISCAKYQTRAIKHQFHEHNLLYFGPKNIGRCRKCHFCGEDCNTSFFCCVICQVDIHLECLPLPLIVKHNRHFHPLTLCDSVVDDLEQYYCDICETERNPEHHIYYCEECDYTAHIDCVISQVEPPEQILTYLIPPSKKMEPTQEKIEESSGIIFSDTEEESRTKDLDVTKLKKEIKNFQEEVEELTTKLAEVQVKRKKLVDRSPLVPSPKTANKIQHFSHKHTLIFCMPRGMESKRCRGCSCYIHGPRYACEVEFCYFYLHKSCGELPRQIEKHSLHPEHPLLLVHKFDLDDLKHNDFLICDGCEQASFVQKYLCQSCRFSLDIKCAFLTDEQVVALKGRGHFKRKILHFSHRHHLRRCRVDAFKLRCKGCKEVILGPTYACFGCQFFLHESCLKDMPQDVNTPFHPQHPLLPQPLKYASRCDACNQKIEGISFSCNDCSFYLHASCAVYQTRSIKHEFHEHDLLYFGQRNIGRHPKCRSCGESCETSFFCCIICKVDIHLECLPLPLTVKHSRHFHPLTLRDLIVEDDSEEYYCDLCETERNPEHHAYYCEECNYTAHINCIISQIEPPKEVLSYLIPPTKKVESQPENVVTESYFSDSTTKEGSDTEGLVRSVQEKRIEYYSDSATDEGSDIEDLIEVHSELEGSDIEDLVEVHSELEEGIENLQEVEEALIGSLELVQLWLKDRTEKLSDGLKKKSTN